METSASLLYKRLNPDTSEIRLLEIPSDDSECWGLVTVSLDDDPEYASLSYVWGEKKDLRRINVQGHNAEVTPSLAAALSRIRSGNLGEPPAPMKYLWADAICINQEDDEERSQQVKLMYRIFSCAQIVYSWLGPSDYSAAFQSIKTLAHEVAQNWPNNTIQDYHDDDPARMMHVPPFNLRWLQHHPSLCGGPTVPSTYEGTDDWSAVLRLLEDPYWERVWIFQEIILARQLRLVSSGSITLSWQAFSMATESLYNLNLKWHVDQNELHKPGFLSRQVWTCLVELLRLEEIHEISQTKLKRIGSTEVSLRQHWDTAAFAGWLVATDPRDYIYGLLAISQIPITPDYGKNVAEVYTDFVEGWVETAKQLGIQNFSPLGFLVLAGTGNIMPTDNFPSWAPNFPGNARSAYKPPIESSIWGDIFGGDPSKHPFLTRNTGSLFVWGAEIEPVLHVFKHRHDDEDVNRELIDMGFFLRNYTSRYSHYISGITSWQAIARLILGKKLSTETRAVVTSLLVLARVLSKFGKQNLPDHLGGWDFLDSFLFPNGWEIRLYQLAFPGADIAQLDFYDPETEIRSWDREERKTNIFFTWAMTAGKHSFFETMGGYLGRGYQDIQEGDVLCVVKDYDHPVLLRKQGDYYTFVGQVFVVDLDLEKSANNSPSGLKWLELR